MTLEQEQDLKTHLEAIAQILYDESDPEAMKTLFKDRFECSAANSGTRDRPELGSFLFKRLLERRQVSPEEWKALWGTTEITSRQAEKLGFLPYRKLSPHLENCFLRLSATVSYEQPQDVAYLRSIRVPAKIQQCLVHRQTFALPRIEELI